jgi:WD40 repeat protein
MGYAIRAWDLRSGDEIVLNDAEFGFKEGLPTLTGGGIALSPDGRYLAVALLAQMEALLPNVLLIPSGIDRSDLQLWNIDEGQKLVAVSIDNLVGGVSYFSGVDLAFSPDHSLLAVSGRQLRIYRLQDLIPGPPS